MEGKEAKSRPPIGGLLFVAFEGQNDNQISELLYLDDSLKISFNQLLSENQINDNSNIANY